MQRLPACAMIPLRPNTPARGPRGHAAAVLAVLLAAGAVAPALAQGARYRVVDLGQSPTAAPAAVSDTGHIVGTYFAADGERRSFMWHEGAGGDIGTLGGIAQAFDVNSAGVAVGYSVDGQNRQLAFRLENGVMAALPNLQGGVHGSAAAINSSGWIVGMSQQRHGAETLQRAALWRDGVPTDLGTLGGVYSEAFDINDAGQVVGWAWNPAWRQRAFLWSQGPGMVDLGTLGGLSAASAGINDLGHVVGSADRADGSSSAFLWTPSGGMVDLGRPPEAVYSAAAAINSAGQIVGNSLVITPECEFIGIPLLWEGGEMLDLRPLIDPASGWTVAGASDINDRGEIAATARLSVGSYRAVLLVPVTLCAADINKDGAVSSADIAAFVTLWVGSVGGGTMEADFTGDGAVNSSDISAFIAAWLEQLGGC